jgi:hypothetical protein
LALTYSGTALPVLNGGTGVTTSTGTGNVVLSTSPSLITPTQVTYENWTGIAAPTYAEGRMWYDSTAKALSYYNDVSGVTIHVGHDLQFKVINNTGSTIANGSPVYITGTSSGQTYPNVALAKADVAATSTVIGLTDGAIANGAVGYVTSIGNIDNVNTGTFTVGQVLYLSPYSAGQLMNTLPPTGITVQVGMVTFVDTSAGKIYVKQTTPLSVPASIITGTVAIANGGTGQTTANTAFNALAPTQTGNSGKFLTTDGTNTSWATNPLGTVTSVAATVPSFLSISGSPITTSGTLAFGLSGTALPTTSGGTGLTSFTANGVVYASSTSALATGSALTWNGSTFFANGTIQQGNGGAATIGKIWNDSGLYSVQADYTNVNGLKLDSPVYTVFTLNNSEQMRLTNTGLGIKKSNPACALDVVGIGQTSGNFFAGFSNTAADICASSSVTNGGAGYSEFLFGNASTNNRGYLSYSHASDSLLIGTAGGTRATLDSSGNLGLGVTPSAWNIGKAIQIGSAGDASLLGYSNNAYLNSNSYYNAGWKYAATAAATQYVQTGGYHYWQIAPSGTAGNAITFTQAMTLGATGNLSVGTTSNAVGLSVWKANASTGYILSNVSGTASILDNTIPSAIGVGGRIVFGATYYTAGNTMGTGYVGTYKENAPSNGSDEYNHSLVFASSNSTAGVREVGRFDSSGNLLLGTTSNLASGARLNVNYAFSNDGAAWKSDSTSTHNAIVFKNPNGTVGTIQTSGSNTLYNVTSDQRLKTNIVDAPEGNVDAIKVRSFDWVADGSHQVYGVVAQELLEVAPYAVSQPAKSDEMMGVDYSKLVPMLVKEIQSLRKRLATAGI